MYVNYSIDKKNKLILVTGSYGLSLGNKTREVTTLRPSTFPRVRQSSLPIKKLARQHYNTTPLKNEKYSNFNQTS